MPSLIRAATITFNVQNNPLIASTWREVEKRRETLDKTVEALRGSLRSAEEHNRKMQEANKHGTATYWLGSTKTQNSNVLVVMFLGYPFVLFGSLRIND